MVRDFFYDEPGTTVFWSCSSKSETVMGLLYGLGVFPVLLMAATVVESVFIVPENVAKPMVRLERGGLEPGRNEQHSKSWPYIFFFFSYIPFYSVIVLLLYITNECLLELCINHEYSDQV